MTDPILHESSIMDTLDCLPSSDNAQRLQAGAVLSLVDAYDRKLTRDQFIALMDTALAVHTQMGKLYMMTSVSENYRFGVLDTDMIDRAVNNVSSAATLAHRDLVALMKKVVSCPTSTDKVH